MNTGRPNIVIISPFVILWLLACKFKLCNGHKISRALTNNWWLLYIQHKAYFLQQMVHCAVVFGGFSTVLSKYCFMYDYEYLLIGI